MELPQPLRHARAAGHPPGLPQEHVGRHRRAPEPLESQRLLERGPDLPVQDLPGDGILEGPAGTRQVGVIDPLDRLLGSDAVFEGQIARQYRRPGGQRGYKEKEKEESVRTSALRHEPPQCNGLLPRSCTPQKPLCQPEKPRPKPPPTSLPEAPVSAAHQTKVSLPAFARSRRGSRLRSRRG